MVFTEEQFTKIKNIGTSVIANMSKSREEVICRVNRMGTDDLFGLYFPVEVRDSPIHGKGVFTTQSVKKGDVLTSYPCHKLCYEYFNTDVKKVLPFDDDTEFSMKYCAVLFSTPNYIAHIYGNPKKYNKAYCGHLINDAYPNVDKLTALRDCDTETFGKLNLDYMLRSIHNGNCAIHHTATYAYIVAIKDICADTELLTTYNTAYWCWQPAQVWAKRWNEYINSLKQSKKAAVMNITKRYYDTFHTEPI